MLQVSKRGKNQRWLMTKSELLNTIQGKVIVSCQALPGEPLYVEDNSIMYLMARAAKEAGACAIRANGINDIISIKQETGLPVIGLIKKEYPGYESYITATMLEVDQLVDAGADIVALDCTLRKRGDGLAVGEYIALIKEKYPDIVLMADISNYEEGVNAWKAGVDLVGTTMSGYTENSPKSSGPDSELVKKLAKTVTIPVIAEGRIHYPEQVTKMFENGAYSVVVGGAITRPKEIASRFIAAEKKR